MKKSSKLFDSVCQHTKNRINWIIEPLPRVLMGYDASFKLLICSLLYAIVENKHDSDIQLQVKLKKDMSSGSIEIIIEVDFFN